MLPLMKICTCTVYVDVVDASLSAPRKQKAGCEHSAWHRQLAGKNSHHIVEATFKAFARALRRATEHDERRAGQIASSKGVLTQQ